jgi:hypothetical protein
MIARIALSIVAVAGTVGAAVAMVQVLRALFEDRVSEGWRAEQRYDRSGDRA